MQIRATLLGAAAVATLAFAGCAVDTNDDGGQTDDSTLVRRTELGKADNWGSCQNQAATKSFCGKKGSGTCYCDSACVDYGDCCADYQDLCAPAPEFCGGFANFACPEGKVCVDDPNDSCDPNNGGADCGGICVAAPTPTPAPTCAGKCGSAAAGKVCYCDALCTQYGDCCADYQDQCGERTPASGMCVKNSGDACTTDADCVSGGCGGELCYNPAFGGGISTCECTAPTNVAGCGCVAGKCSWYN